jgi:hypothetical protein
VLDGTSCGQPASACRLTSACYDTICFDGDVLPDGASCDDGDPCTVGDTCRDAVCLSGTRRCDAVESAAELPLGQVLQAGPGGFVAVDCSVRTGTASNCTAAAFLPAVPAAIAPQGTSGVTPAPDVACDFTRQITRTAMRPFSGNAARVKLKLSKLGRRLMKMAAGSLPATMTICTKIVFANGESIMQVGTELVQP